jgi:hypothetical protein
MLDFTLENVSAGDSIHPAPLGAGSLRLAGWQVPHCGYDIDGKFRWVESVWKR